MRLREVLNELQSHLTEEFKEEQLLDLDIKVETMSSDGRVKTIAGVKDVRVEVEQRYSNLRHKKVPLYKSGQASIILKTSLVP